MGSNVSKSIAVLGAGVTGLTAAYRLTQYGHRVRLFEATGRVGGSVRTERTNGWLIEGGPNSVLTGEPALGRLITELGLTEHVVTASALAKNRYIVRRGRPLATPDSPGSFFTTPLFSTGTKLRVFAELLTRPRVRTSDLSLEEFVRSHFGQELVDYGLNPFVAGVYAGNPQKLSARHAFPQLWELEQKHGSLLRGFGAAAKARKTRGEARGGLISFQDGLQTLPDALAARLPVGTLALHARLEALIPTLPADRAAKDGRAWSVVWHDGTAARTENFDCTINCIRSEIWQNAIPFSQ